MAEGGQKDVILEVVLEETDGLTCKELVEEEHACVHWDQRVLILCFRIHSLTVGHLIKKSYSNLAGALYLKAWALFIKLAILFYLILNRLSHAYLIGRKPSLDLLIDELFIIVVW